MKKLFITFLAAALFPILGYAQDTITRKDGQDIIAKVLEVNTNEIVYKLYDEPDGPTYVVNKSEILLIRYESGRNEVINNNHAASELFYTDREPVEGLSAGMKYRQLKQLYNYKEYTPALADRYSLGGAGIASFFIPGLGQMICNEFGRGFLFLLGSTGCSVAGTLTLASGVYYDDYGNSYMDEDSAFFGLALYACALLIDISAITNAVRVAKVKNMYEQDLKKTLAYEIELHPSLDYAKIGGSYQPVAGLTLALRF